MTTKEKLLELFELNRDTFLSGEEIAARLLVSRTAVWKGVKSLQADGYRIDAVSNRGYRLSKSTDKLSKYGIKKYLKRELSQMDIEVREEVSSTNAIMHERAAAGAKGNAVLIASAQTAGRGRFERKFFSPQDTGVYMSLLLRPKNCAPSQAVEFTTIAAVSMCEAIEAVSDEKAQIKWVNDIFINDKKVCGILTEASISLENGFIDYVVLGVGVNVCAPQNGFPNELENTAGAIFSSSKDDIKNRLTAEFLNRFMEYSGDAKRANYAAEYKKRSFVLGRKVLVLRNGNSTGATALDIDESCHLLVRYDDGTTEYLSSGEISVKLGAE